MKNGFLAVAVIVLLAGCNATRPPFTKSDVRGAQRVAGMSFTDTEVDTLYRNLTRNLDNYLDLRKHPLDNSIVPALRFDPRPPGFVMPSGPDRVALPLPDDVARPPDSQLAYLGLAELGSLVRDRKITSLELTRFFLGRLREYDDELHAVVTYTEERALESARRADAEIARGDWRGPLHGIPYGAKDLLAVPGYPTTWGAGPYRDQVIDQTAAVIRKLDDAGAVLIAKLVSGELASGDRWFGGRTRTPWDITVGASGSSAGPGAATAAGLVPFAIGTETWGSIISPSTRGGLAGLRPTFGRVSRAGAMTLSWSLDKIGPMCRSARDCALVFDAIRGSDPADRSTVDAPLVIRGDVDWTGIRMGYVKEAFDSDTTATGDNARAALEVFRAMGLQVDSVAWPGPVRWGGVISTIIRGESGAVFDQLIEENGDRGLSWQGPGSRANSIRQSRFIPASEYIQANRHRTLLMERMDSLMTEFDLLIAPSGAGGAVTNLTGHPAITVPSGFRAPAANKDKRLPTGVSLIGRLYDEGTLLEAAMAFQARTQFHNEHPPDFK
jgi:Asp-tRNA(Asn)/Glu-tRNA(Gln) amidotransferase A subunit family amidase